jgi:hypothetical protein
LVNIKIKDIKGWKVYDNNVIGINFNYPNDWSYNESNNKHKVVFINKDSAFRFYIHYPADNTGYEGYDYLINKADFSTNKTDIKLHYELLKSTSDNSYLIYMSWKIGSKEDTDMQKSMILVNFSGNNYDYYKYIIDNFIKTFRFIE